MKPALVAHDTRVGGSAQSSTLSVGLPRIAKALFPRCDRSLPSPRLIFGVNNSRAPSGSGLLFCANSAREHELILAFALWLLSSMSLYTPYGTLQLWMIVRGLALGLSFQPLAVSALSEIRPRMLAQATAVNTTVRFVMSSFAVAVMATLVQAQTAIHYAHLAERVTPASPLGRLVPGLQALFMQHGASASAAYAAAIQVLIGLVQEQATVLAMQDAFRVSVVLAGIAIAAAFFVRSSRPQPTTVEKTPVSKQEQEEAAAARKEGSLAL